MLRNYYLYSENTYSTTQKFRFNYIKNNIDKKDLYILDEIENIINRLYEIDNTHSHTNTHTHTNNNQNVGSIGSIGSIGSVCNKIKISGKISNILQNILKQYDVDIYFQKKYCGLKKYTVIKLDKIIAIYNHKIFTTKIDNNVIKPISSNPIKIPNTTNTINTTNTTNYNYISYNRSKKIKK